MANVHMILQGKGGVGKSLIAATLAQYKKHQNENPLCIDTDPVNDFLKFICKVKKSKWPFELIESLNLEKHLSANFLSMSYGTKKKFLCIAGLIGNPQYLLLDEPLNGLDQEAKEVIFHLLTKHLIDKGICVIVSHDLSWIDKWREKCNYCLLEIRT